MPRVKRGTSHLKKRKKLLKKVKGYKWGRKKLIRLAKTAVLKAGVHSYVDRKKKKRNFRALWQIKISAFVRQHELSYSKFINVLKINNIALDRKVLSELAVNHPDILAKIVMQVKK
ncbi:MAG: 50S ribosomal protein L20 [Patescibacteria group bacterium]|nr:50S ribosomal protein L20 [Patescibacteria group bacterium]MBU1870877.1 50S ribosomal protein L20 [Patescibacteria group bacterium]